MYNQLILVLRDQTIEPDMQAVRDAILQLNPGVSAELLPNAGKASPLIVCGGQILAVMSMPAQVPRDDSIVQLSTMTWPEVGHALARHRAHVVVSAMGEDRAALEKARVLTAFIGALVAAVPGCTGVVWGKVAHPAQRWSAMSKNAFAPFPNFPFTLWVGIHPFRTGSGVGVVTSGLRAFVGREAEVAGRAADLSVLINRAAGLAAYLIERGSVISDGDTIGASETERLTVRHMTSRRFPGVPVLFASAAAD